MWFQFFFAISKFVLFTKQKLSQNHNSLSFSFMSIYSFRLHLRKYWTVWLCQMQNKQWISNGCYYTKLNCWTCIEKKQTFQLYRNTTTTTTYKCILFSFSFSSHFTGMMDIALLTANANQLRFLITYNTETRTFYISTGLIVLSLIIQVLVGMALIFKVSIGVFILAITQVGGSRRIYDGSASNSQ